jgi:hypothetical protein
VAMIVSTYIERPILVDIRTRKSKHGGASVPVVKDPLDGTQRVYGPAKNEDQTSKIIENAINIVESPRNFINKARTIIESQRIDSKKNESEKIESQETGSTKIEPPQHHEEIKEQIERKKGKREVSLYRKMFGSRKK